MGDLLGQLARRRMHRCLPVVFMITSKKKKRQVIRVLYRLCLLSGYSSTNFYLPALHHHLNNLSCYSFKPPTEQHGKLDLSLPSFPAAKTYLGFPKITTKLTGHMQTSCPGKLADLKGRNTSLLGRFSMSSGAKDPLSLLHLINAKGRTPNIR